MKLLKIAVLALAGAIGLFVVVVVVAVVIVTVAPASRTVPAESAPRPAAPILARSDERPRIHARDLYAEYEKNAIAADAKFKGHRWIVSGTIDTIDRELLGRPQVTLATSDYVSLVQLVFPRSAEGLLSSLSKGQFVAVECELRGKVVAHIAGQDYALQ